MAIYDFFVSRNGSVSNTANYVGHAGRLFYDSSNGVIKLSDGTTPGGLSIPYTIATSTVVGGIKAGPGANVAVDGTLTIDTTGLPLGIGNLKVENTTLSAVNLNDDILVESTGTGNVSLVGNVFFHPTNGPTLAPPYFQATSDGQITILVPASDPLAGAVKIIGSTTGRVSPPINTGVMLQLTGNNNEASRLYNDAIGAFAAFVGRRINGNLGFPTAVLAGDEIIRISSTGHNGTSVPGAGSARIVYQAVENYTPAATGSNISIWTCAIGSNTLTKIVTVDSASGLTATKATIQGNLTVNGNLVGNAITTTATIGTANVATINISAGTTTQAPVRYTAGTNLTTSVAGAFEYDGIKPMFTPSDSQRGVIPVEQFFVQNTDRTLTYATTAAQNLFAVNPTLSANTRYFFRLKAFVGRTTGDNNSSVVLGWGGTATLAKVAWTVQSRSGAANTVGAISGYDNTITTNFANGYTVTGISNPPDTWNLLITGIVDVGASGGTFAPTLTWSGAVAAGTVTIYAVSNFHIYPISNTTGNVQIGNWV